MNKKFKTLILTAALTTLNGSLFASSTDSTMLGNQTIKPAVSAYLLERGIASTQRATGNYTVKVAIKSRCNSFTTPVLNTSVKSIEVLGRLQAIQGVNNSIDIDPKTYVISGSLTAPLNADAWDSGATVNWQVWCQPKETA